MPARGPACELPLAADRGWHGPNMPVGRLRGHRRICKKASKKTASVGTHCESNQSNLVRGFRSADLLGACGRTEGEEGTSASASSSSRLGGDTRVTTSADGAHRRWRAALRTDAACAPRRPVELTEIAPRLHRDRVNKSRWHHVSAIRAVCLRSTVSGKAN